MLLAIDTTSRGGSVALAAEGEVKAIVHHDPSEGYAESLLELCDQARARAGVAWTQVESIAVVRGPGSFTGLRIGIMTAKTLAFARGWTLWAADALPLLAAALDGDIARVALLDAGAGHVFAGVVEPEAVHCGVERVAIVDLAQWMTSTGGLEVAVDASLEAAVRAQLPGVAVCAVDGLAETLARRSSRGVPPAVAVEPHRLLPLYASPSQAERVHGVDLRERVHEPIEPTGWE